MIPDSDLIRLCAVLYPSPDPAGSGSPLPHIVTAISNPLGTIGHVQDGDTHYIIFPGSRTFLDWYQDFDVVAVNMGKLGLVHAGFMALPLLSKAKLDDALLGAKYVVIAGHSLGAAHALDYAALRLLEGAMVSEIVTFGSPMPGCQPMHDCLASGTIRNYINMNDPVTTKPFPIPFVFPCVQMREFIHLDGEPDPDDTSEFRFHHSWCYYRGLMKLKPGT